MAIRLEDRWFRQPDNGTSRIPTSHYGETLRYRGHFTSLDGTHKTKLFRYRPDAEHWLVQTEVADLLNGDV